MKIKFLPVHIMLTKTLEKRDEQVKVETRRLSNNLIGKLLWRNAILEQKLRGARA